MEQLAEYYKKSSWSSVSVDFVKSQDDFTGPTPGLRGLTVRGVPRPERVFNLYWCDDMVDKIVHETNRYARTGLPHPPPKIAQTKGGCNWKDVNRSEIRGWLGICILMGCKKLPSKRHY